MGGRAGGGSGLGSGVRGDASMRGYSAGLAKAMTELIHGGINIEREKCFAKNSKLITQKKKGGIPLYIFISQH